MPRQKWRGFFMPFSVCQCTHFRGRAYAQKTLRLAAPCGPSGSLRSGNPIASRRAHLYSASSALKQKRFASRTSRTSRTSRELTDSPPDHYSTCFCLFYMVETLIKCIGMVRKKRLFLQLFRLFSIIWTTARSRLHSFA